MQVASAAVAEEDGDVTFLHRITPGAMGKSYGIHVARLAGLPPHVLERAREILLNHGDTENTERDAEEEEEWERQHDGDRCGGSAPIVEHAVSRCSRTSPASISHG